MNIQDIPYLDPQGQSQTLGQVPAKAILVVNVASKCGLTPQYEGLQELYKKYHSLGLEILGFPANEFLAQEPGTDAEIQEFCSLNYQVTFPINRKIVVKGEGQHPLYKALTEAKPKALKNRFSTFEMKLKVAGLLKGEPQDIKWNFEKFLVRPDGTVLERFAPDVKPTDNLLTEKIEEALK